MPVSKVFDSIRRWIDVWSFQARWAIGSRWRRARGLSGAFEQGEVSARAAHLTDLWEGRWPMASPLGYELRVAYAEQWVRFHSLPESKRYAESDDEYAEILRRHRTVLRELHGSADLANLWVIAADWGSDDFAAGCRRATCLLPGLGGAARPKTIPTPDSSTSGWRPD